MSINNLTEQVVNTIGKQIVLEKIAAGEILPKVETFSKDLGVSRTVIREAMKGLITRGLIRSVPKVGTIVLPRNEWQWWDPDMLSWASEEIPNSRILLQLTEVRLAIEPFVASLAAQNASKSDILEMKACFETLEKSITDVEAWAKADFELHNCIFKASKNELLINLGQLMYTALLKSREATMKAIHDQKVRRFDYALDQHREVLEAIYRKDQQAAFNKMSKLIHDVSDIVHGLNE